jgi:hypothetical protein
VRVAVAAVLDHGQACGGGRAGADRVLHPQGRDEDVPDARREHRWGVSSAMPTTVTAPRAAGEVGELLEHRDDDHGRTLLDGEGELLDHVREFDQQGLPDVPAPTLSMTAGWHTLL